MTAQRGSAIYALLRLLAACCVVVVGVIAAQLIMQRFELGAEGGQQATPAAEPAVIAQDLPASPTPPEPEPATEPAAASAPAPDGIRYQVQATFISDPPTFSRALLRGPDGQSKWYLAGQEPESGLLLKEVRKDRVVFTYRGEERVQLLKRDAEEVALEAPSRGADAPLPQPYSAPIAPPPGAAPPGPAKPETEPAAPVR